MVSSIKEFKNNLFFSGLKQIFEVLVSFLLTIVLVRFLTKEDYGVYRIILSTSALITGFALFGWPSIYIRYLPELKERNDITLISNIIAKGMVQVTIFSVVIISLFFIFFNRIQVFLNIGDYKTYFYVFIFGFYFLIFKNLFRSILNGLLLQQQLFKIEFIISLIFRLLLLFFLFNGIGLIEVLIIEALFLFSMNICFLKSVVNKINFKIWRNINNKLSYNIKKYGYFSYLNDIGNFALDITIDNLIIMKYLGAECVAIYMVGAALPQRIKKLMPTTFFRSALLPIIYTKSERIKDDEYLNHIFQFFTKINFMILVPAFLLIIIYGESMLGFFYGAKYVDSYPYLIGLSFFFFAGMFPIGYVTSTKKIVHVNALSKLISFYNLVMDVILIQLIGLIGVVIATGSSQLFKNIYVYWHSKKYTKITFPKFALLKIVIISLLFSLIIKLIIDYYVSNLFYIIPILFIFILLFFKIILMTKYYSESEISIIENILGTVIKNRKIVYTIEKLFKVNIK